MNVVKKYKCITCQKTLFDSSLDKINEHLESHGRPKVQSLESSKIDNLILVRLARKRAAEKVKQKIKIVHKKKKKFKKQVVYSFYDSNEWLDARYFTLKKYGRNCACCGETEGQMHVDHIIPRSIRPDLELEASNLQVLCRACNLGKSNKDSTNFINTKRF